MRVLRGDLDAPLHRGDEVCGSLVSAVVACHWQAVWSMWAFTQTRVMGMEQM